MLRSSQKKPMRGLVAKGALNVGDKLTADNLGFRQTDRLPPGVLKEEDLRRALGQVVRQAISKGGWVWADSSGGLVAHLAWASYCI